MSDKRRKFTATFKTQVALEALRGLKPINEIASQHGVHPNQVSTWKKQAQEALPAIFEDGRGSLQDQEREALTDRLYQQIGQLKVELDWLKKNLALDIDQKRELIEMDHPVLSIARQCELLGLARSSRYCELAGESPLNLKLMGLIDRQYTATPFYGSPRMTVHLRGQGDTVGHKRVERLMRRMGLAAVQPRRNLSQPRPGDQKYPSLLRDLKVERPGQVWSSDITSLGLRGGFLYLVAVMDWFSRYVLSWELSNTLDSGFCLQALSQALMLGKPDIFNTDQGSQFTSQAWTGRLQERGLAISMDGRGRCFDNIFTERLWRTVKYEAVYLKEYADGAQAWQGLDRYFRFYNQERYHQALGWRTPAQVHYGDPALAAAA